MVRDWDMGEGGDWEQDERSMLARAYRDALGILKKHRAVLDALAQELQQKENLDGEQFLEIMIRYIPDTIYPQFGGGQNAALPV